MAAYVVFIRESTQDLAELQIYWRRCRRRSPASPCVCSPPTGGTTCSKDRRSKAP